MSYVFVRTQCVTKKRGSYHTDWAVMISLEGTNSKRSPWRRLCLATSPLPPDSTLSNSNFCFAKPSVLSHSFSNVPFSRDRGSQPQSTPVLFLIPSHHNQHNHRHHPHRHKHHQRRPRQQIPRRKRKKVLRITPDILKHYSKRWETTEILPAPILTTRRK